MSTFRHPAFPDVLHRVADDDGDEEALAKGWVPLLAPEQKQRLAEIEDEVEAQVVVEQLESDLAPRE